MNRHHAFAILLLTVATTCQAEEKSTVHAPRTGAPSLEQTTETIGSARMEADAKLVLQLVAGNNDGTIAGDKTASDHNVRDDKTLLATIQTQLDRADTEIARRDFENANNTLNAELGELGNRYSDPRVIDDSGMKLIVARDHDRNGRLEDAARIRRNILNIRLHLLRDRTP
ncbi:MAG: hypothetical protein FWD68_18550 [Alphaproteobacteria bacterium]|nr:hypothetical protein [Alphaproteobacteria bacterium]